MIYTIVFTLRSRQWEPCGTVDIPDGSHRQSIGSNPLVKLIWGQIGSRYSDSTLLTLDAVVGHCIVNS